MRIAARLMAAFMAASLVIPAIAASPALAASPPNAVDDTTPPLPLVEEDAGPTAIDVLGNDSDPDGDLFTIVAVTQGTNGAVVITGGGTGLTYQPDPDFSSDDSFTYTIDDGNGGQDTATVSITVSAWNDAPSFTTLAGPTVDEDSGPQTVTGFATGSAGPPNEATQTLSYVIDGNTNPTLFADLPAISDGTSGDLTFTPAPDASGSATISVHAWDHGSNGNGDVNFSPTQTFTITVNPVNDPPVAVADGTYGVRQDLSLSVNAAAGVLANDTDVDTTHAALTAVSPPDTNVTHGTLTLNSNGSFTYTPNASYVGTDSFTYHARDGAANSNVVAVSLNVYVNHAPIAVADTVTVVAGSSYTALDLLTNDNTLNPDAGEALRINQMSHPAHGTVVITGGGTGLSYRPAAGFHGTDHFSYGVTDGAISSSLATVTVKVPKDTFKPVATAPVQTIGSQSIGTSTVALKLTWTGTDKGSGIAKYQLWQSVNGHSYTKIKTTTGRSATVTTSVGKTYRFRVRAIDKKGNVGAFATGPAFRVYRYQETAASIVYTGAWPTVNSSKYSGGHADRTSTAGASAAFTTSGRTFAWIANRGSSRGTADVYVDGVLRKSVSLTSSSTSFRRVAYSLTFPTSGAHTITIVHTGAAAKTIDVDAFIVLR